GTAAPGAPGSRSAAPGRPARAPSAGRALRRSTCSSAAATTRSGRPTWRLRRGALRNLGSPRLGGGRARVPDCGVDPLFEQIDRGRPGHARRCGVGRESTAQRLPAAPAAAVPSLLPDAMIGAVDEHIEVALAARCGGGAGRQVAAERFPVRPAETVPELVVELEIAPAHEDVDPVVAPRNGGRVCSQDTAQALPA